MIYKLGKNAINNPEFHSDLWDLEEVYYEDTITNNGKDWNFEQHKKQTLDPKSGAYSKNIGAHLAWEIENRLTISSTDLGLRKEPIKNSATMKSFMVSDVFDIYTSPSYNKESLVETTKDEVYDYITRTSANRGICDQTGFISDRGLNEAGVFSLGLLQMIFFYRERKWYAGQFVRKIVCKYPIDKYMGIYLETILNALSEYLLSGLVRDVDDAFLNAEIRLPVTSSGDIDFEFMRSFVIDSQKNLLKLLMDGYNCEYE